MTRGLMLGSENSEFQVIVLILCPIPKNLCPKTVTRNFSELTKALNSENIVQVCPASFKTQGQCNSVKDALSEFRVIAFWCRAINDDSELGNFFQSMIFLEFQHS